MSKIVDVGAELVRENVALKAEVERLSGAVAGIVAQVEEQRKRAERAEAEVKRLQAAWEEKSLAHANAHAARRQAEAKLDAVQERLRAYGDGKLCRAHGEEHADCTDAMHEAKLKAVVEESNRKDDVILGLEGLLAAYRLGSPSRADVALTKLEKARAALAAAKENP